MKITFDLLPMARKLNWKGDAIDVALGKNKLPETWKEIKEKLKRI